MFSIEKVCNFFGTCSKLSRAGKGNEGRGIMPLLPYEKERTAWGLALESADVEHDVADIAARVSSHRATAPGRAKALARFKLGDTLFHGLTLAAAIAVLVLLSGVILSLIIGSIPAIQEFGFNFLVTEMWNPVTDKYGAAAAIYGTVVTSLIAMVIAIPAGIGIAVFLTELCPQPLRSPLGIAIELLAGIPSIIYGIWGLFIVAPLLQQYVEPRVIALFGPVPFLNMVFAGPPYGIGIFTAGFILAIMVLPFISSISRDVFMTVPPVLKESAYGLGFTTREVVGHVVIPYTRTGIIGGVMLALGRALGETMAVTFIIGNAHRVSSSILAPGTTISATIANEFTEAVGSLYTSALIELGLILFAITFVVLAIARYMLMRIERQGAN
jgi:phosphate transport system permease protein